MLLWEKSIWSNSRFPKGQPQRFHLDSEIELTCFNVDGKTTTTKKVCCSENASVLAVKKSDSSSSPSTK